MSDLLTRFNDAVTAVQSLAERPDNHTLLRLYALFKQATAGDASGRRPGFTDLVGRAKFDAWAALQGTTREAAMAAYADLVAELKG